MFDKELHLLLVDTAGLSDELDGLTTTISGGCCIEFDVGVGDFLSLADMGLNKDFFCSSLNLQGILLESLLPSKLGFLEDDGDTPSESMPSSWLS